MSAQDIFFAVGLPLFCVAFFLLVGLEDIAKAIRERNK